MAGYSWSSALCLLGVVLQLHAFTLPHLGICPDVSAKLHFSMERYQGYWFQRAGYNTERVDGDARCTNWLFELVDNDHLHFQVHGIRNKVNAWIEINGTIKFPNTSSNNDKGEAKLILTTDTSVNKTTAYVTDYWVLGTDYSTYSVVYNCKNHWNGLFHYYSVWLLARTPFHLTDHEKDKFNEHTDKILESQNITISNVYKSDLSRCTVNNKTLPQYNS